MKLYTSIRRCGSPTYGHAGQSWQAGSTAEEAEEVQPAVPDATAGAVDSREEWLAVRHVLTANRQELSHVAARLYPGAPRVGSTDLLTRPQWLPDEPLDLDDLPLSWEEHPPEPVPAVSDPVPEDVRPLRAPGARYATYAGAVGDLDRPVLFEDRPCYRLLGAALIADPGLRLARTSYFDGMELGHAAAHELAAAWRREHAPLSMTDLPLRARLGDPCVLEHRRCLVAVTTLTLRRTAGGAASFVLHWRDPAKVNHAGGLYQVMPVGLFQPVTGTAPAHDLSLWKCMIREFSEEFLGTTEDYETRSGVLDYDAWPFYRRLTQARRDGRLTVRCLGVGVDPLSFATDILTVAVFDSGLYDAEFGGMVASNAEGRVITGGHADGIPFTEEAVTRLAAGGERMQASGAALLQLAWQHRRHLPG
jgi:hypothetical protein